MPGRKDKKKRGDTTLHVIARSGDVQSVELLLEILDDIKLKLFAENNYGDTALTVAVGEGYVRVVELLLKHGADDICRNPDFLSAPIYRAIYRHYTEVVELLVPSCKEKHPLMLDVAVQEDDKEIVKILLKAGFSPVSFVPESESTLLHSAANLGFPEILKLFLDHMKCLKQIDNTDLAAGSDSHNISVEDCMGWTALHHAAVSPCLNAARLLLEAGVDAHIRDIKGRTALDLAISSCESRRRYPPGFQEGESDEYGGVISLLRKATDQDKEPNIDILTSKNTTYTEVENICTGVENLRI